jgi:hypothetical protein
MRDTGTNYHRYRMLPHQFLKERNTVHPWHFDVQGDNIRYSLLHFFSGDVRIRSRSHHLDLGVRRENFPERLPRYCGIIYNEHTYFFFHIFYLLNNSTPH